MKFVAVILSIACLAVTGGSVAANTANGMIVGKARNKCSGLMHGIHYYRHRTWHLQDKLNREHTKKSTEPIRSCKYAVWVADLWRKRSRKLFKTVKVFQRNLRRQRSLESARESEGVLTSDWACIHHYEGAWDANTGNGYYGGLQMDISFMEEYGSEFLAKWGTADRWPVWAQVTAANRAKNSGRGYGPWPNTARYCGLL